MSSRKCTQCDKRRDVETYFTEDSTTCNKCALRKCAVCQQRKDVNKEYYKSNPTTCKKCAVVLAGNRRKVGIVSLHDKVEQILEKQDTMLKKQESYVRQVTKQMAILQDLAEKVDSMDKEMAKLAKKIRKMTVDQ